MDRDLIQTSQAQVTQTAIIQAERKLITIERGANHQGEFLKVYENSAGRNNVIVMPFSAVGQLRDALDKMMGNSG